MKAPIRRAHRVSSISRPLHRLGRETSGTTAVVFGILIFPIAGLVAVALDYSRTTRLRAFVQSTTDGAALAAALEDKAENIPRILDQARARIRDTHGASLKGGVDLTGEWVGTTDYRVRASMTLGGSLISALPGLPKSVDLSTVSVARLQKPVYAYEAPRVASLDPEALDYNQIAVYCFNPASRSGPTNGRSQMTTIADNAGTKYEYTMPRCGEDEVLSFKLTSVREARANPKRWNERSNLRQEFFTDTTLVQGVMKFNMTPKADILESVVCDTFEVCKGQSQGGVIPEGSYRSPAVTTRPCDPGKFLYLGWEDRPSNAGWTDRDFNDIRIVIACPKPERISDKSVWLVQ